MMRNTILAFLFIIPNLSVANGVPTLDTFQSQIQDSVCASFKKDFNLATFIVNRAPIKIVVDKEEGVFSLNLGYYNPKDIDLDFRNQKVQFIYYPTSNSSSEIVAESFKTSIQDKTKITVKILKNEITQLLKPLKSDSANANMLKCSRSILSLLVPDPRK
jgi:hypothetical protein